MIKRALTPIIQDQLSKFPVVAITGPRQSGKTTLTKAVSPTYKYYNLEDINTKALAIKDPVAFVNSLSENSILDEIQKVPDLLSQIQVTVDESKKMGQFIITGSENLRLSEKISQSLAGRVANNVLLPFSYKELKDAKVQVDDLADQIIMGFYPRIYDTKITFEEFYPEYVNTYVEKDVRQIKNIGNLVLFEKFLKILAGRVGQLVGLSSISNDVGVSHNTIESWLSILEVGYIIFRLQPYYRNFGKRVIKSPKFYFHDTGLLCYLLGINEKSNLESHYAHGSIYENLVISEISKHVYNNKLNSKLYFYRDSNGNEVDLLIDSGSSTVGIEIKASKTFIPGFLKGIKILDKELARETAFKGAVVYKGEIGQETNGVSIINFFGLDTILKQVS